MGSALIDPLTLADNIFVVKQFIVSSRLHTVHVDLDSRINHLKPDQALLVIRKLPRFCLTRQRKFVVQRRL